MDKQFYTVTDIRDILTIGTNKAYNLIKSDGFPNYQWNICNASKSVQQHKVNIQKSEHR